MDENQTDWVLGVDFRKDIQKISFSTIFPQIGKSEIGVRNSYEIIIEHGVIGLD